MNKPLLMIGGAFIALTLLLALVALSFSRTRGGEMDLAGGSMANDTGATPAGVASVVDANNRFASELYARYAPLSDNVLFSPFGISSALAMTYEGAKGKTAKEMQAVFHFPEDAAVRRPAFARICNEMNGESAQHQLSVADALWAQKGYPFLESYLALVNDYYGGKAASLDFSGSGEASRQAVNLWAEGKTNGRITELLPGGAISGAVRLVLTDAAYFKGNWARPFDKGLTQQNEFRVKPDLAAVTVPMMELTGDGAKFGYGETENVQAIEMPYAGNELSMLVILPKNDSIEDAEKLLSPGKLGELRNNMSERRVDVRLPKFRLETAYSMANDLYEMGMPTAFLDGADFSGMTKTRGLFISKVIHKASVEVDEEGTEAAAAAGGVIIYNPTVQQAKSFNADHPFVFIIQEKATGNILFLGRVSDPTKP